MSPRPIVGQGTSAAAWAECSQLAALPHVSPASLVAPEKRAVIVSPHPDDEVLGSGGLLTQLGALGRRILVIAVTDGAASYPNSSLWSAARLAAVRPEETREALHRLGLADVPIVSAGLADGAVRENEAELSAFLRQRLQPGDVVITTWRRDGHPDHEASAQACLRAARAVRASFVEAPIWTWHWAVPNDARIPWTRAVKIMLDAPTLELKHHAVAAYVSQIQPDAAGAIEPVLAPHVLARLVKDYEVLLL